MTSAGPNMGTTVLEQVFPADDEVALAGAISEDFVNHEAPAGTPPGRGSAT
jgi:hypothetical protein